MTNSVKWFIFIFIFFLLSFRNLFAQNIYYINSTEVYEKSKLKTIVDNIVLAEKEKLKNKYNVSSEEILSKGVVSSEEMKKFNSYQKQLIDRLSDITFKVQDIFKDAIEKFAKQRGYDIIVAETMVFYVSKKNDKTSEFLKFFNNYIEKNRGKILSILKR